MTVILIKRRPNLQVKEDCENNVVYAKDSTKRGEVGQFQNSGGLGFFLSFIVMGLLSLIIYILHLLIYPFQTDPLCTSSKFLHALMQNNTEIVSSYLLN